MKLRPNGEAPQRTSYRLGAKGGLTAQAWQHAWDNLSETEWKNANDVAKEAARLFQVKISSVRAEMYAAASAGHLETELRPVELNSTRKTSGTEFTTTRKVTHYRIKKMAEGPAA